MHGLFKFVGSRKPLGSALPGEQNIWAWATFTPDSRRPTPYEAIVARTPIDPALCRDPIIAVATGDFDPRPKEVHLCGVVTIPETKLRAECIRAGVVPRQLSAADAGRSARAIAQY